MLVGLLSEPRVYDLRPTVDSAHKADLVISFSDVELVYADLIGPEPFIARRCVLIQDCQEFK